MKTTIYLIRHGITDWNKEGRYQGSSDIPLNSDGLKQAQNAARELSHVSFKTIYSSPLIRAYATAQEIAKHRNVPIELIEGLRERSFGEFEGMTFDEIEKHPYFQKHLRSNWYLSGAPQGESFDKATERVGKAFSDIISKHGHETIGVVAHGGVIKSIGHHIGHLQKETIDNVIIENAKPLIIEYLHSDKKYNIIDFPFLLKT